MKTTTTLLTIFFISLTSLAAQVSSIYSKDKKLSSKEINRYIQWVEPYIKQYRPKFKSTEQQKKIYLSSMLVIKEILKLDYSNISDSKVLAKLGHISAKGHNLDLQSAPTAKLLFEKSLEIESEDVKTNYLMGMFLVSTRKYFYESIPYLEKALKLGQEDARFTLALIKVKQGKLDEGLKMLEKYSQKNPENEHVKKIIQSIKDQKLKFKESN